MFRNECSDAKKNTQFFHGISTMRFLDHPILLMLQKQFHPGFWLTFPSIFQSPFSHPIAGYVFFQCQWFESETDENWGCYPFSKTESPPPWPWPRQGRRRRVSPAGNGLRMHWTALKLKEPR